MRRDTGGDGGGEEGGREEGGGEEEDGSPAGNKAVDPIRNFSEGGGVGSPRRGGMTEHVVVSIGKEGG